MSYDEKMQYLNTEYESILIGLGCGEHNKHLLDENISRDMELTRYYENQIVCFVTVFRVNDELRISTYKTNNPKVNGINYASKIDI